MKHLFKYLCLFGVIGLFFTSAAFADGSLGDIASSAMGPMSAINKLVRVISVLSGFGLLFTGIVKFTDWRRNPVETSIGLVIVLILAGLSLIALGMLPEIHKLVK